MRTAEPRRTEEPFVDPAEDAASIAAGLRLAPAVEAVAALLREKHMEQRRAESEETTVSKIWKWDHGRASPMGGRHNGEAARRAYTLVEALVVLAIICVLFVPAVVMARAHGQRKKASESSSPAASWVMFTEQHDGHWWVIRGEHFLHHPDCPCRSKQAEAKP